MTEPRDLWDFAAGGEDSEREDRDRTRRGAIKRLRASGHWVTLLRIAHHCTAVHAQRHFGRRLEGVSGVLRYEGLSLSG